MLWEDFGEAVCKVFTFRRILLLYDMITLVLLTSIISSISFYSYYMTASINLHNTMFSAIMKTQLQFFYTNPTGSILNRFSKDLANADTNVPKYLIDSLQVTYTSVEHLINDQF